jgi:hypothetical protein
MGLRSKLGWAVAAVLAATLIYRDDSSRSAPAPANPQLTAKPSPPVGQLPANPAVPKVTPEPSPRRPNLEVAVAKPEKPPLVVQMREMFTTARVRLRAEPSTKSAALRTLEKGTGLVSTAEHGGWFRISHESVEGWIRGDYLTERPPEVVRAPDPPPVAIVSNPPRQVAPIRMARTGEPTRLAVTGHCDCPYDRMRNGRRCGGNSAWSKPGGRSPVCFVGE